MTTGTTEYTERQARVIGEDGEIFDSIEEYTAWVNDVKAQLARSEADRKAGREYEGFGKRNLFCRWMLLGC